MTSIVHLSHPRLNHEPEASAFDLVMSEAYSFTPDLTNSLKS